MDDDSGRMDSAPISPGPRPDFVPLASERFDMVNRCTAMPGDLNGSLAVIARFSSLSRGAIARAASRYQNRGSLMRVRHLPLILSGLVAAGLAVSGCAAPGASGPAPGTAQTASAEEGFNDPFEDTNRGIFGFNKAVDDAVLVPTAKAYRTVIPPPMRQSLHDFMQNLNGPVIFMNDMLQGEVGLAAKTLARLAINTTVGVGGMFDVATRVVGIPYHSNDLGITLAVWGFAAGPYVIVPVLGPSNPRDLVGQVADGLAEQADRLWRRTPRPPRRRTSVRAVAG